MSNELLQLVGFLNSELLWVYVIIVIVVFYAILSLLTWNIKKPLMFLGIPTFVVGILQIIVRFLLSVFVPNGNLSTVLNSATKPLFVNGIICVLIGISMIIVYNVLNRVPKKEEMNEKTEIQ